MTEQPTSVSSLSSLASMTVLLWAMNDAPVANVYERTVLMVYADRSDPDGCNAYPSVKTVARTVMCDPKTVRNTVKNLVARGLMRPQGGPPPPRLMRIPEEFRPKVYEVCLPHSYLSPPQLRALNEDREQRAEWGDEVNSVPLTAQNRPDPREPERKGRKTRSDKGKPNPQRSPKKTAQTTPPAEPDTTTETTPDGNVSGGGGISYPPSKQGGGNEIPREGGNEIPQGGGIRVLEGGVSHTPNPPHIEPSPIDQRLSSALQIDPLVGSGAGSSLSNDGSAAVDAPPTAEWSAEEISEHLPEGAKVSGPGLERIARRCVELEAWGLEADQVRQILAGVPKSRAEKAFLERTATPEQARSCLDEGKDLPGQREDVDKVCEYLADKIAELGYERPTVTREWRCAARLLIDKDTAPSEDEQGNMYAKKVTVDAMYRMIDWAMAHTFWGLKGNIRSMPTFRRQFKKLVSDARVEHRNKRGTPGGTGRPTTRWQATQEARLYGSTSEMFMDQAMSMSDPNGYASHRADAERRGQLEQFLTRFYGEREQWSSSATPERVETIAAALQEAGYNLPRPGAPGADAFQSVLETARRAAQHPANAPALDQGDQEPKDDPKPVPHEDPVAYNAWLKRNQRRERQARTLGRAKGA